LVTSDDLFTPVLQTRVQKGEPRYTATLSKVTSYDPVALGVTLRYFGPVTGKAFMNFDDEKTWSGKWLTDVSASVAVIPELVLTLGGQNIFNVFPDEWGEVGNEYPEIGYTYGLETLPFGVNGRFFYLGAKLTI
jgi:iron complex outermembrane receptor protein